MAEQLEFDPAMFGMKSNHGMLRSATASSTASPAASGANAVSVSSGSFVPGSSKDNSGGQSTFEHAGSSYNRGHRRGGGASSTPRGRGGSRGGRGRGGRFNNNNNNGQRSNDNAQQFKVILLLLDKSDWQ